jgi:hypothetical protein
MGDQDVPYDHVDDVEDEAPDMEEDDSDLDDTSFSIGLNKTGQKGGYHTHNHPKAPFQRQTITERRSAIDIRCKSREVIHGYFGPESDNFATLLVYDFHFDAAKRARRVAWANVTFKFSSSVPGAPAPEVHAIAPLGRYTLLSTTQEESYTRGGEVKADAGQMGVNIGATSKWEKTVSRTTTDDTRLVGATVCDEYGKEVGVNWLLHENNSTKTGVPSFLRTAILLKRADNNMFQCAVTIDVEADWKTELTRFFGSKEKDDPILFDPDLPPTNKLRKSGYNTENLGSINVEDFFDVTFQTTFGNAIKAHVQADEKGVVKAHVESTSETLVPSK